MYAHLSIRNLPVSMLCKKEALNYYVCIALSKWKYLEIDFIQGKIGRRWIVRLMIFVWYFSTSVSIWLFLTSEIHRFVSSRIPGFQIFRRYSCYFSFINWILILTETVYFIHSSTLRNILIVKNTTWRGVMFPMHFQCPLGI